MKNFYNLTTYLVFGIFSILTTFYFPYLNQEIGLSFGEVSTIVSIGALFTLIAQPILANRLSKAKVKKRFILIYLGAVFIGIIGLLVINADFAIIFAPIYGALLAPIGGIFEVYIEELSVKHNLEFSSIRKWGSIGYGCIVLLGGGIITKFGYRILHILAMAMIIVIAWIIAFKFDSIEKAQESHAKISLSKLAKNNTVVLLGIIIFLGIGSYMGVDFAYSSYLLDITKDVNKANTIYSLSIGIRVFIEFFSFMLVAKFLSKANSKTCLTIAFFVASLKMILFSSGILPLVVLGDQLHGIMFSLYLTFLFKYLREILDSAIVPSAYALLTVFSNGGANFVYPSLYSFIQSKFGYNSMYFFGFILVLISILLAIFVLPKGQNSKVLEEPSIEVS